MTKCKDCKRIEICGIRAPIRCDENFSCSYAERADGLTMCCATCKYHDAFWNECKKEYWTTWADAFTVNVDKMLCPEWVPREEKE